MKALVKSKPETLPAYQIVSIFSKNISSGEDLPIHHGQLLSVGAAVDVEHQPGYRTIPIMAIPHGGAGHVLRLIKPNLERHGWRKKGSVTLSLMDPAFSEEGHWTGIGGTIHQIVFADDGNVASTWLAVRQAFITTIFRPMYNTTPVPAATPLGHGTIYPPSRLGANPVAILTAERTGSVHHVDVSFNPYYARQFAVVDDIGAWSIWNIEGRTRNRSTLELVPGKSGRLFDGYAQDPTLKEPDNVDGWHRLLWVSNVSTLVICNRRHISVFDVKSTPKRLQGDEVLPASSTDWILDVQRSVHNLDHLFILTSSRIFWVKIMAAGEEDNDGAVGARILLSYRHFRNPNDKTMKLTILKDGDSMKPLIHDDIGEMLTIYSICYNLVRQK
jgi:RNA polymerase I-specific transcription initiation factor RRN6